MSWWRNMLDVLAGQKTTKPATTGKNNLGGWDYRLVRRTTDMKAWFEAQGGELPLGHDPIDVCYGIHEAYYDKNDKVHAITDEPVAPVAESPETLKLVIKELYMKAFNKPILDYDHIPEDGAAPLEDEGLLDLAKEAKPASEIIAEQVCCGKHDMCQHGQ